MSMKQTLTAAMVCVFALNFNAFAKVAYDNEVTNTWFSVTAANADLTATGWTKPDDGEVSSDASGIKLDTDLDDPLTYEPASQSTNAAIVSARFEATANTAEPTFDANPQAALTVIVSGAETNWYGLVGGETPTWVKFTNVIPDVGTKYDVKIEFDLRSTKRIRYSVGNTVLIGEGSADGWYANPKTDATAIASVSFAGTGDIGDFGGQNVAEAEAGFNGQNYKTFTLALVEAKKVWPGVQTPVVLYKNVSYSASETETLYVNANNHTFTINGEVAVDQSGNTYTITKGDACEAKIGTVFYSTIENAIATATEGQTITVNKALEKSLTFNNTSVTLDTNGNAVTCATLTVADGVTLTLANALTVANASIAGSVAGSAALTVTGTLTGTSVATLTFGDSATFAYAGTPLAAATLGTALHVTGLSAAAIGTTVITSGATDSTAFTSDLPTGKCLEVEAGALKVASVVEIADVSEDEGYDYTNGTVNVTATVKSGTATAVLTVVGWDGKTIGTAEKSVTSGTATTWDVAEVMEGALTQGGAYTYTVDVKVGGMTVATKTGEFTAAKWDDDIWFGADASKASTERVTGGSWAAAEPTIANSAYVIEDDAVFNVAAERQDWGSNRVTRVDAKVTFESLVDGEVDMPDVGAIGGFVATTGGWKALTGGAWVSLTGHLEPVAGKPYVIRAEIDFISATKRVRYLVSEDDGTNFFPLASNTSQWIDLAVQDKSLLAQVELQGSGMLAKFEAMVADKALAVVGGKEYDSMAEALAAAGTEGTNTITLLTNATIEPDLRTPGKYAIVVPEGYKYMSGGNVSRESKTIVVEGTGKPPVVRLNDSEMREVRVPGVDAPVRNTDKLRKFLEDNGIESYTGDDASSDAITQALTNELKSGSNQLKLWQDYALGVDKDTPVAPVTTPAGDTDAANITLAIPAVKEANYSGDYTIKYQVTGGGDPVDATDPSLIKIPVNRGTGTYTIKVLFTPATAQ